jgi:sugar phosphate isomerase/epimerase
MKEMPMKTVEQKRLAPLAACCAALLLGASQAGAGEPARPDGPPNAFFALDTATKDQNHRTAKAQAEMLKELGYAGIACNGAEGVAEMLSEVERVGLKLTAVYLTMSIDSGQPDNETKLRTLIDLLRGHDTVIWLLLTSSRFKPSAPGGDDLAVKLVGTVADQAQTGRLRIALYPHVSCWLERVSDALRVTRKANRPNLGVTFNLCHWLKVEGQENLGPLLEEAKPRLFLVTINGADAGDTKSMNWDRLIQTLDRGSFDVGQALAKLHAIDYRGPIGFQGYGIGGDVHDNLQRTMAAWRRLRQLPR